MTDAIFSELDELRRQATSLQGLIAAAQASAPRQAEGADSTGTVWATIGADGLPASVFVPDGWQRRLPGERFGGAVVEAFAAATDRRIAAWNEALSDGGWPSTVDNVRRGMDAPHVTAPAPPPLPAAEPPRSLDDLLNDVLTVFDHVDALAAPAIVGEASGTSGYQKVTVRLSPAGLVSCVVDEPWAAQQSAATLMEAFAEALARAKAELVQARASRPLPDPDRVLGQALALLNDPRPLAGS
jgi:hypothetical protein